MRIRKLIISVAVTAGVLLLPGRSLQAEPQYIMKFGSVAPLASPWGAQLNSVKSRIESQSNGRVRIALFMDGKLGDEEAMVDDVVRGERLQGGGFSAGALGEKLDIPLLSMTELPYLFRNVIEADAILDGVLYEPTQTALGQKGLVLAAWAENGWRSFATTGGPATTPAELAQYKMRAQNSSIHEQMYASLGAQPVKLTTAQVLPSLESGIVNGFDNTPLFTRLWLGSVTHYTLTRHIYQAAGVVYSKKFMERLPADLQAVVMGDPAAEAERGRIAVRAEQKKIRGQLSDEGVTVVKLSKAQVKVFRETTNVVHTQFIKENPEMVDEYKLVKDALTAIRSK
jgi:TRAP-type C4-dicarboxylate transport system substrate-binding protein